MLSQEQNQQYTFSQTMALNLSILQMNRIALNILVNEFEKQNPLIEINNNITPWKDSFNIKKSINLCDDLLTEEKKLFDKLREELFLDINESDYPLLYLIIGNLNSNGFLIHSLETLCKGTDFDIQKLYHIRKLIMNSSYLGLGAFTHQEYLLFMSDHFYGLDSLEFQITNLFIQNKRKNLTLIKIAKILKKSITLVENAIQNIKKIAQSPLDTKTQDFIYPDFIVTIDTNNILYINPTSYLTPTISIKDYKIEGYTKKELKQFLNGAAKLQNALNKRIDTLQKHAEALILLRSDFFIENLNQNIQKVTLKDVAQITQRSISTVSRSLKDRYFLFKNEIYPFTVLLTHKVGNSNDYQIKKIIKQLIENENSDTPLSDTVISVILQKKGIHIARRTVNKYRQELKLNSSYLR